MPHLINFPDETDSAAVVGIFCFFLRGMIVDQTELALFILHIEIHLGMVNKWNKNCISLWQSM